jgi:pimeloyl-ACP methyl ester carboxylesterase
MTTPTPERIGRSTTFRSPRNRLIATLPVTERRLDLNGVSTSVLEGGSGAPIVLLHGPGAYGAQWIHAIPALAATHRVIAPDLPGHGVSAPFGGAPTPERVAGWLDDLIECTCSRAPILVGHTLGGAIAMRFAAAMTRPLAALVLVDTLGLAAFQPAPAFGAALQAFLQAPTSTTHDALWSQCVFDLDVVRRRMGERWQWIKAYNLSGVQAAGTTGLIAWMEQFGAAVPGTVLDRIQTPTTLIWGRHDRATPLSIAETAHRTYGWKLEVIDGAADDPTLEQPEAFLGALRRAIPGDA